MNGFDPDHSKQVQKDDPTLVIRKELRSGEHILWQGSPLSARVFRAAFAIYLFAIPWTAFALFWESMAFMPLFSMQSNVSSEAPPVWVAIIFPLFGLPFIAIGFWMLAKPFTLARKARQTRYIITNQRALIVTHAATQAVVSFPFEEMNAQLTRTERADGSGSLYFSSKAVSDGEGGTRVERQGFEHILGVRDVEAKLSRALRDSEAFRQPPEISSPLR